MKNSELKSPGKGHHIFWKQVFPVFLLRVMCGMAL
jgi:hypothetical protein